VQRRVRELLDLASTQHSIITRTQARAGGLSGAQVDACVRGGLLVALAQTGLYRVRGARQSVEMAVTAAVLGTGGSASFAAAARLLRLDAPLPLSPIDVTVFAGRGQPRLRRLDITTETHSFFAVRVHRFADYDEPRLRTDCLPCTDAARTLIDIATRLDAEALEVVFERARRLGLVSVESLARRFATIGGRGRPGTRRTRALLAGTAPNALESKLEVKAWRLLRGSRIPDPIRQLRVGSGAHRHRLDFAWPELMVAFETEGFEWHGTHARWKQDRIRVAALERLGWRRVVATWNDIVDRPEETLDRVADLLSERAAGQAAMGSVVRMSASRR
jgi:very-short-patch-repair endonuclease